MKKSYSLGGAILSFLITDAAAPDVRATDDVDVIVELDSYGPYLMLQEELRSLGFSEDTEKGAPICRWLVAGTKVDVMPDDESILGFSNRWYREAVDGSVQYELETGLSIRVVTAPLFIATKLEAFAGRGGADYMASADIEDIVTVLDGRPELMEEVAGASKGLRDYLAQVLGEHLGQQDFLDALPGHVPPDEASQARVPQIIERLKRIIACGARID